MSRYARKKDANHTAVVAAFEFAGCDWLNIESPIAGAPDGILGISGRNLLVEIKPNTHLKAHALRPEQKAWAAKWRGSPVHVVRSPAEAWALAEMVRMTRTRSGT